MCLIRPATEQDVTKMAEVEALGFPASEAAPLSAFQRRFAVFPECFFVLEVDKQVVGFINGCVYSQPAVPDELYANEQLHCPDGDFQTVFGLVVHPNYQGQGFARQLVTHFITASQNAGRKGVVLTCKDKLLPFYQSIGFVFQGVSESTHGGVKWNDMLLVF